MHYADKPRFFYHADDNGKTRIFFRLQGLHDNREDPTVDSSYFKQHYSRNPTINEPDSVQIKSRPDKLLSDYPKMDESRFVLKVVNDKAEVFFCEG